jgi:hypothetical protein
MSEVTKGEWKVVYEDNDLLIKSDNGLIIADIYKPNALANATLMAASKELLEALELLLYGWDNEDLLHDVSGSFEIARLAINKAKPIK